jgi:hypothetical protein
MKKNGFTAQQVRDAVDSIYGPLFSVKHTLKKVDGEICVRLWVDGKHNPEHNYFTDDKLDALQTADAMEKQFHSVVAEKGLTAAKLLWELN